MRDYDIKSDLKQEQFQTLKLVQGDRGNKIKINVFEEGQPVNLAGCSITAKYKRADGEVINNGIIEQEFSSDENFNINYFYAVMDSDITKVVGTLKMLFTIEKDDVKVSTFLLLADVREGIGENTGSSGGSTGGGEVTVDLSNYYKKSETYSKAQIDSQFKDIAKQVENVGQPTQQQINTAIDKAIEEGRITGSGGINSTAKTLLETILRNAIYTTDQSANITSLVSALSSGNTPTTTHYTITNTLTKCTNGNSSSSVAKNTSYIATITPNNGYKLDTVTVTMGGVDVTSTVYNNGKITINSVTGNIVITATAIEKQDVAEMPTNGLVALFDKDSEVITNGAYPEYQYQIKSKQGDYILGSWNKQVSETTNYGVRAFTGDLSSDKKIDTTIESPTTWVVCSYLSTISCNGYAPNNLGNLGSNSYFISANPLYINTNNESVSSEDISSFMGNRSVGYHRFILVIDGNYLKIYKNAKLIKTLNGSDFSNFSKWKTPTGITGGFSNGVYTYFEAIYNRALSDVEVVELDAYIQTLEVNK